MKIALGYLLMALGAVIFCYSVMAYIAGIFCLDYCRLEILNPVIRFYDGLSLYLAILTMFGWMLAIIPMFYGYRWAFPNWVARKEAEDEAHARAKRRKRDARERRRIMRLLADETLDKE